MPVVPFFPVARLLSAAAIAALVSVEFSFAQPVIVGQSRSYEVFESHDFIATVDARGDSLSYQWFKNGTTAVAGATSDELHLTAVSTSKLGAYHVVVTDGSGKTAASEPVSPQLIEPDPISVTPGTKGYVRVPGTPAAYHLYLPSSYATAAGPRPVLITFNPSGGGMVNRFQTVAEERGWVIVGVVNSRNGQSFFDQGLWNQRLVEHVLLHLDVDPNQIFFGGFSGGGWLSFRAAKCHAPISRGVFSMGGWLGNQRSLLKDRYLPGLLVARANGTNDTGANLYMTDDRTHLQRFLDAGDITDYSFSGGHAAAPDATIRQVFQWFESQVTPSNPAERLAGKEAEARWKADITSGRTEEVLGEIIDALYYTRRTPEALAAWRAFHFLLDHPESFRHRGSEFLATHPFSKEILQFFYYLQPNVRHDPNRSRLRSLNRMARYFGTRSWVERSRWHDFLESVSADPVVFRATTLTALDEFILAHNLWELPDLPYLGDWDGDGMVNWVDLALGGDPLVADAPSPASVGMVDDAPWATFPSVRSGPYLELEVESSADFDAWVTAAQTSMAPQPNGAEMDLHVALPQGPEGRGFARVSPSIDTLSWSDPNHDGITREYGFGTLWNLPYESDSSPDQRFITPWLPDVPYYLEYLTDARVRKAEPDCMEDYAHVHPLLLGRRGLLYHEIWTDIAGSDIASGLAVANSRPADLTILTVSSEAAWHAETDSLAGDRYFERTRGYYVPAVSGQHVFMIAGDDASQFRLSSSANPAAASTVASLSGWTGRRNFTQQASQISSPISLTAGVRYYFEILHKEGNGGDHCTVFVEPPGGTAGLMEGDVIQCLSESDLE
ncbi:hypothetical protein HAHE_18420 [Haloferula helveola]|uniref:Ig-like domain-containing protein n=1 Tax=Haloferula helveola TaxID=490095 RepID=A0ABM7RE51_9BACT|nr:hypothetical protein HAHE_18420 [Haloferula helveola]